MTDTVKRLLVTGPESAQGSFHRKVYQSLNAIDQRGDTFMYTCMAGDFEDAIHAARICDVTVQEIVVVGQRNACQHDLGGGASVTVSDNDEVYPVHHQGSHGMKWERGAA